MNIYVDLDKELAKYIELVNNALARHFPRETTSEYLKMLTGLRDAVFDEVAINESIIKPAWDLLSRGGKRWRPVIMLLTYEALGGDPAEIADLSIVSELIHNGTLVVDDVEDNSDLRRGKPCIHKIYGVDIAINMGNTLYYLPLVQLMRTGKYSQDVIDKLAKVYIEEMLNLSIGQALDIAWHRSLGGPITEEMYLTMCRLKTGSLVRLAARMACSLAKISRSDEEKVSNFSDAVAVAFQIQDDILNIAGEEEVYGKEIGGDIKEGKRTLMVVYALRTLEKKDAERLEEILRMRTSDPQLIKEAISLIKKSGALRYAENKARELVTNAWRDVEDIFIEGKAKELLRALTEFLITRKF